MEKIRNNLATISFTLALLLGLNIGLQFFEINLGIENKFIIWPLAVSSSILFLYLIGSFVLHGPEYFRQLLKTIRQAWFSVIKLINKLMAVKLIKYGLFPVLLFVMSLFLSTFVMFFQGEMRSVLTKRHRQKTFVNYEGDTFTRGDIAAAVITADDNNFGIVAVKFDTHDRVNDDVLEFRIKEEKASDWYYVNEYKTDQFQDEQFFPFGFPKIKDSIGKNYLFEIESLYGDSQNAVSLSTKGKVIESRYQFSMDELGTNKVLLARFITKKLLRALNSLSFWISSLIYLVPFFIYIAYVFKEDEFKKNLSTIEDYFSLALIIYLINEIVIQLMRLGSDYSVWDLEPSGNLMTTSNLLLGITLVLGVIVALGKQDHSAKV